jgi:hypothetical protein
VQLWRRSDCGPIEKISEAPIDFDWRSALQTVDGTTQPIPRSPGVSLLAKWLSRSEELVAVHYDGFAVRLFIAKASDGWRLSERIIEVNRTRDDYAFVE